MNLGSSGFQKDGFCTVSCRMKRLFVTRKLLVWGIIREKSIDRI